MGLRALALALLLAGPAAADPLRIATWDPGLSRDGPGLLLRDITARDPQVVAAAQVIAHAAPDAILLTGLDWDLDNRALTAFAGLLAEQGHAMPHHHATQSNRGMATGVDLDGDGRAGQPRDAQGYGAFTGQAGLAVLSRHALGDAVERGEVAILDVAGFPLRQPWRVVHLRNKLLPLPAQAFLAALLAEDSSAGARGG